MSQDFGIGFGQYGPDVRQSTPAASDAAALARAAASDATKALTTASGKGRTYFQDVAPSGTAVGLYDLWFDTDDGNCPYKRTLTNDGWVKAQLSDGAIAELTASKISSGTVTAQLLLSGSISTSASGARTEMTREGFTAYGADEQVTFKVAADGQVSMVGALSTGRGGNRIELRPDTGRTNAIDFYSSANDHPGSIYAGPAKLALTAPYSKVQVPAFLELSNQTALYGVGPDAASVQLGTNTATLSPGSFGEVHLGPGTVQAQVDATNTITLERLTAQKASQVVFGAPGSYSPAVRSYGERQLRFMLGSATDGSDSDSYLDLAAQSYSVVTGSASKSGLEETDLGGLAALRKVRVLSWYDVAGERDYGVLAQDLPAALQRKVDQASAYDPVALQALTIQAVKQLADRLDAIGA